MDLKNGNTKEKTCECAHKNINQHFTLVCVFV